MNVKNMVFVIGLAAITMLVWTTVKVYFIHDPDNFMWADAKAYAVAFRINQCKQIKCDSGRGPWLDAFEVDEGWVFVIPVKGDPDVVAVLFPRDEPRKHQFVEVSARKD
jgi:hypothetical protein